MHAFCVIGNVNGGKLKDAVTRCVLRPVDASKCDCGQGSALDLAGEAYSAPQTLWLDLGQGNRKVEWKWLWMERERNGRERKGTEGRRERRENGIYSFIVTHEAANYKNQIKIIIKALKKLDTLYLACGRRLRHCLRGG